MFSISVCLSPALYPYYSGDNSIVVVIDIFRATTSMCVAFQNGVKSIRTVATLEEAMHCKSLGFPVAAERNVKKCDFADFGNSPFDFTSEKVAGKELVFTTTNGTQAIEAALNADEIILGAFSNISALTAYCIEKEKNVTLLCSGWNNRFCMEDTLFAGALAERLTATGKFSYRSDALKAVSDLWNIAKPDLFQYICQLEHYRRLRDNGLENSVAYCLQEDTVEVVPVLDKESGVFKIKK